MKKASLYLMIMIFSLGTITTINASENKPAPTEIPVEVQVMLDRIDEIKEMDKSELKRAERKELRKEVRAIKKKIRKSGNGIYISSGAIIIILLLIIIL